MVITGYGVFREATSTHSVEVLKEAIARYGKQVDFNR